MTRTPTQKDKQSEDKKDLIDIDKDLNVDIHKVRREQGKYSEEMEKMRIMKY